MISSTHRAPAVRVLVIMPTYGGVPATGALVTTQEFVRGLVTAGHRVDVITTVREPARAVRVEDGVRVWPLRSWRRVVRSVMPQLLVTHHGDRKAARIVAQTLGVPHLLMVHGMSADLDLGLPALAWFPSDACRAHYRAYRGRALVLRPPVNPDRYRALPGDLVTLNGSTDAKGGDVLARLAARTPEARFLMVRSPRHDPGPLPPNVELTERTDPRNVYARTRLLLMPSAVESYGRVGVEAMVSGIPVLAAPLPGVRSALESAAVYVEREDIGRWVKELRRLENPEAYAEAAARSRAHAGTMDFWGTLNAFTAACQDVVRGRLPRARPARRPVRRADVVAWVHYGVPYRRAGSETMLHTMMRVLKDEGLDVLVICCEMPEAPASWTVEGVPYASLTPAGVDAALREMRPRVVITHHYFAERAVTLTKSTGARSVLLVHNDHDQPALSAGPDLCVYNSEWVRTSLASRYPEVKRTEALVVHPPVLPGEHRTERTGTHVTLVNLNRHKGVDTWRGAAAALPGLPFLGVTGAHGRQISGPVLPNMRIAPQTSDMRRDVWALTRVLLVPSVYESYGMAAVEALASGIPVIAHPTPGLRESLGDGAVFRDRADVPAWTVAISDLYEATPYRAEVSAGARARSAVLARQGDEELRLWVDSVRCLLQPL